MNFKINEEWFYSDTNKLLKIFGVFIKGDMLIVLPFWVIIVGFGFISRDLSIILTLMYLGLRYFGEMIYWFLQQFFERSYRPYDFGLIGLSNNSIYIIYQLFSLIMTTLFWSLLIFFLKG